MPSPNKPAYYAVRVGHQSGIYRTWEECKGQVDGYSNARYREFSTGEDANDYLQSQENRSNVDPEAHPLSVVSLKVRPEQKGRCCIVYACGVCARNGTPGATAGIGVWWGESDSRNLAERCPGAQTNNRAELIAFILALEQAPRETKRLIIRATKKSSYTVSCIEEWITYWATHSWKRPCGKAVKNELPSVKLQHGRDYRTGLQKFQQEGQNLANYGRLGFKIPERTWHLPQEEELERMMALRL